MPPRVCGSCLNKTKPTSLKRSRWSNSDLLTDISGNSSSRNYSNDHKVHLTLIDAVQEHLDANENVETKKIRANLLELDVEPRFDLGLVRSLLHYFSLDEMHVLLENIRHSIKPGGYALFQLFVQDPNQMDLFMTLSRIVGKQLTLMSIEENLSVLRQHFSTVKHLGAAKRWDCSSNNLAQRYSLSAKQLAEMREIILNTPEERRGSFTTSENGFTIPIPYEVILVQV